MSERPPLHPLSIAGLVLGSLAAVFTAVLLSAFWRNPHLLPSDRNNLWLAAWVGRWWWPPLAAALAGWVTSGAAIERLTNPRNPARRGLTLARAALALSVGCGGLALVGLFFIPMLRTHEAALKTQCLVNVKDVATALNMYVADWDRFPAADHWTDLAQDYLRSSRSLAARDSLRCPDAAGDCAYAYNASLALQPSSAIADPSRTIALFESDGGWNAHGGRELLTDFPRHMGGDNIGLSDGYARWFLRAKPTGVVSQNQVRLDTKWPHEYDAEREGHLLWQPTLKPAGGGK